MKYRKWVPNDVWIEKHRGTENTEYSAVTSSVISVPLCFNPFHSENMQAVLGLTFLKYRKRLPDDVRKEKHRGTEDTEDEIASCTSPRLFSSPSALWHLGRPQFLSSILPDSGSHFKSLHLNPGQKLDKNVLVTIWLMLLSATLAMSVNDFYQQRQLAKEEVRQRALETIEKLLAEFGDMLLHKSGRQIAACYIRYSTDKQNSFEAQLRAIFNFAVANGLSICRENIFYDLGISGAKHDRHGLNAIRQARSAGQFQVFLAFTSSRLARNLKTLLEVLNEEFVGNGTRSVLVDQNLDSKDLERWKLLLPLMGWLDEVQRNNNAGYIRAAHRNLLARRMYYSSETYGYGGEVIEGFFTKRGRPVRLRIVDSETAAVVNFIFDKFISDVSIGRIVTQLNEDTSLPRPPKSTKNRFSRDFVKHVLECEFYLGVFIYNSEADVSALSPDEMRELANSHHGVFSFAELQIVSDEKFLAARERLQLNSQKLKSALRVPRSKDRNNKDRPTLLNGFLFCPSCDNQLVVTGAKGAAFGCKTCKFLPVEQQFLYSQMPRRLATDLITEAICDKVFDNDEVMARCVDQFLVAAEGMQKPDPSVLAKLKSERKQAKDQLGLLVQSFTGEDVKLVKDQLDEFRHRLTKLDSEIAKEQRLVDQVVALPSREEAYEILAGFSEVLKHFSTDGSDDELDKARELINLLTGGRVETYQCGQKKAEVGWLQVRFKIDLAAALLGKDGLGNADNVTELVVDIREDAPVNPKIALAREMYDQDYFENEIAAELGASRASVNKWVRQSYEAEDKSKPNGYKRRKRIEKARGLHHYQQIGDLAFELEQSGLLICEIAEQLNTNRDVITAALREAYKKRGLSWLDGRARRKSLDRKSR